MKTRTRMPLYASLEAWYVSGQQLAHCWKRGYGDFGAIIHSEGYAITKLKDRSYWVRKTGSGALFWMARWYQLPKIVGTRLEEFNVR